MNHFFKRSAIGGALLAAGMLLAGTAQAGEVTLDVAGISSNGELGDASNETRFLDILADVRITGISWNVGLSAAAPGWLSDIRVYLQGAGGWLDLAPGIGDNSPGSGSYSGAEDLVASGNDFYLGADGRLNFEFFDFYDDLIGAADGSWDSGSLTVSFVPEPATFGLAALALLGVGATTRRRKS